MARARGRRPQRARMQRARTRTSARIHSRPRQQSRLDRLFPPSGLRSQLKAGLRLARSTPGLSLYLGGGLAVWLLIRALEGQGLASTPLGALAVGLVRLLGLALVAVLYFRRTGRLAQAHADLRRLRCLLAERRPWLEEPSRHRRRLFRVLGWSLRVRG